MVDLIGHFFASTAPIDGLIAQANAAAAFPLDGLAVHAAAGGIATCWLFVICKLGELGGDSEYTTRISPERRLPGDSDVQLGVGLMILGAVVGCGIAVACGQQGVADVSAYWPASLVAGVVLGIVVPLPLVKWLTVKYLERAKDNMEEGNYKHAMQDASEAERMAFAHHVKQEAKSLMELAKQYRNQQLDSPVMGVSEFDSSQEHYASMDATGLASVE